MLNLKDIIISYSFWQFGKVYRKLRDFSEWLASLEQPLRHFQVHFVLLLPWCQVYFGNSNKNIIVQIDDILISENQALHVL